MGGEGLADRNGACHVGIINNSKLKLGLELQYEKQAFPRLANWQHFGPGGSYVSGIEPLSGSLLGKDHDDYPLAAQWLDPGQTRRYQTTIRLHADKKRLNAFAKHDGKLIETCPPRS